MTEHALSEQRDERTDRPTDPAGLHLGRYFGVEIVAHWSLLIIIGIITVSLALGAFPRWHPEWSTALTWIVSLVAAMLFFASVGLHELAHALVGRVYGIPIRRITLFLFGGMAHMEREPPSPRSELFMAAVGPLTSLIIGLVSLFIGSALASDVVMQYPDDPAVALASVGPVATILLWLGSVNILLAVFNMLPGFPLDGGRVLRALMWWGTGDLRRATRWASAVGQAFAWLLITFGLLMAFGLRVPFFGRGPVSGLWLILIGWFLNNAARMSYAQVLVTHALEDVPVRAVMRHSVVAVPPELSISRLVHDYMMTMDQRAFPVTRDGQLIGLVTLNDVRRVARVEWDRVSAGDIMTPASRLFTVRPDEPAVQALQRLSREAVNQLPVVQGASLVGMVRREDIMKWLHLQTGLGGVPA